MTRVNAAESRQKLATMMVVWLSFCLLGSVPKIKKIFFLLIKNFQAISREKWHAFMRNKGKRYEPVVFILLAVNLN